LGEIKRRQLRDFSREKFGAEHRELVRVRKRLRILLKGYELGTNNPELSFLSEIRA
jgi:hypothetical protein